ncbi:Kazal-type serine protease inhibitor domain-containing protein [Rhizobium terrae]|uniref:Kazal-type serine protease inhibitor domain-containing protein n=1 Tax=Rhizobium terrae TaxID=2171756 RepID=UPI001D01196E|nr:Kazal-type serine protease inhibitor domain-containing protein [Rhizobium terrae]
MYSNSGPLKKLSLLLLLPVLSACVEGGPRPGPGGYYPPPRPQPQQMCTMEYRPVCGERSGRFETFGNACQAGSRGYRIVSPGECRGSGTYPPPGRPDRPDWNPPGRPDRPDWDRPNRPDRPDWDRPDRPGRPERPGICTREYRPVCGQSGGRTQTFPNACEASNAGFGVIASGECRR